MSSLHTFGEPIDFLGKRFTPTITQAVMSLTLDGFVDTYDAGPINHIKIDVDGLEAEVLAGALRTVSDRASRSIMIELNVDFQQDQDSLEQLLQLGYRIYRESSNPPLVAKSESIKNFILVRE